MPSPFRADEVRALFPIFGHTTYVDSCSCGAPALPVLRALDAFSQGWGARGSQWEGAWYDAVLGAEEQFAQLIGATPDEVVFLPSVSNAAATLAGALDPAAQPAWKGRTRVLIPEDEFPTIGQVWLKQPRGVQLSPIPADSDNLAPYLGDDVLLVALSHVNYSTGRRRDLASIVAQAHQFGAWVLVDASQNAGTMPIDVAALDIDLLVTSGHKYLLGAPGGGGFLFVRQKHIKLLEPPDAGWAAHRDFIRGVKREDDQIHIITGTEGWNPFEFEYAESARRFSGGTANIPCAYMARAGLRVVRAMNPANVAAHVEHLASMLITGCCEMGIPLKTPLPPEQRGPMVAIACSDPAALVAEFAKERIEVSQRGLAVRVSLHGYNIEDDVRQVLAVLSSAYWLISPTRIHSVSSTT